jgi:hypothetical protein
MRSGRAYLAKRMPTSGLSGFETRELREVLPHNADDSHPTAEISRESKPREHLPSSDLEKNQWTVVSFAGVEAGGLTYEQASRLIDVLADNGIHGLCVITDVAALKID